MKSGRFGKSKVIGVFVMMLMIATTFQGVLEDISAEESGQTLMEVYTLQATATSGQTSALNTEMSATVFGERMITITYIQQRNPRSSINTTRKIFLF